MRLRICAAALAAALCLCSCSSSSQAKPCDVDEKFQSEVKITQNEKEFCAKLSRADADIWEMDFSKPDTVAGMKLTLSGNVCTLDFKGLKYELDRKDVSQYSMANLCCGAMEDIIGKRDLTCTKDGDKLTEKGTVNGQDFTAVFEDGKIKELTVQGQLKCEF